MLLRAILIFALAVAGCDKPAPTNRLGRQPSAPVVPSNPNLDAYIGEWTDGDRVVLSITPNANGSATIAVVQWDVTWDWVINNVRFDGSSLRYDVHCYYAGEEDFSKITYTIGDDAFHSEATLTKGDTADTITLRVVTRETPEGLVTILRRRVGESQK